jgi:serine/threonine protein kinase
MSNSGIADSDKGTLSPKPLADEYGNLHYLGDELARGGQGVVFHTLDADLAVKQPLNAAGEPDKNADLSKRFQNIRLLPLPPRIQLSMPLAILRDEPGYVMRLLNGMKPLDYFSLNGKMKAELREQTLPKWLANVPDKNFALELFHYTKTGSTRRRLYSLAKCASILARLHCAGLVYGDISHNNVFVGEDEKGEVWLIDADNLRFELIQGGLSVSTQSYGAPELVKGLDHSRPRTDCWAFAVLAFRIIALCHPFIGKKVLDPDNDEDGWAIEPVAGGDPIDLDEQAYAGFFPFIDDKDDKSNESASGLSRELVATPGINLLFQETFSAGRTQPHRRPSMMFWALELAKAYDLSLICPNCKMSYFANNNKKCPYCKAPRPPFLRARTQRWEIYFSADTKEFALPHRLFNPFSLEYNDDAEYEAVLDFAKKSVQPVRGTKPFPEGLLFDFEEAVK